MKTIKFIILFFFSYSCGYPQFLIEWSKTYGGPSSETVNDLTIAHDSDYVLVGCLTTNNAANAGIMKLQDHGNILWQKSYGSLGDDQFLCVANTNDSGYLAAGYTTEASGNVSVYHGGPRDVWVVKLDSGGNIIWEKTYGGSDSETAFDIIHTSDNGFLIAGETRSNDGDVTGHKGNGDCWLLKIDSLGVIQWQKTLGGPSSDKIYSVIENSNKEFVCAANSESSSGDLTGNYGYTDGWLIKVDSSGNLIWQDNMGGTETDYFKEIIYTSDNGYIIIGDSESDNYDLPGNNGYNDIWYFKMDSTFNLEWNYTIGGPGLDHSATKILCKDSGILIVGLCQLNTGSLDVLLTKINDMGEIKWSFGIGGSSTDYIKAGIENEQGNFILAGYTFSDDIYINSNNGLGDIWLVKLNNFINTITGISYFDRNENNIKDANEKLIKNYKFLINNSESFAWFTEQGNYIAAIADTGYITIQSGPMNYFVSSPMQHHSYFPNFSLSDSLNDFAFQPAGNFNDLRVKLIPLTSFRPGFNASYRLQCTNPGTTSLNATVVFYPHEDVSYVLGSQPASYISTDSVIWNAIYLNPFDTVNIDLVVNVDQTTQIGDLIDSHVKIAPVINDVYPFDNYASWEVIVRGSFDPNDILVNRSILLDTEIPNPDYLDYIIRFQNTGNDTAFNVVVKNNITELLDLSTFELLSSSHPLEIKYQHASRLFEFAFNNILLVDSNMNGPLSHGYIHYRIKPLNNLIIGDSIKNKAAIYFDFNAPVITNTALTEVILNTSIQEQELIPAVTLYPNPVDNELNILCESRINAEMNFLITNILGQKIREGNIKINAGSNTFRLNNITGDPGVYLISFFNDDFIINQKYFKI